MAIYLIYLFTLLPIVVSFTVLLFNIRHHAKQARSAVTAVNVKLDELLKERFNGKG